MSNDGKVRILAVDDNPAKLLALSAILSELKETVVTASSGREALRLLLQQEFAVVLLDVHMPGMDGYETIRAIRATPDLRSLPIIALTAKAMKGDREKCIEAGAWDYLSKPVNPDQLLAVLRAWLHR